MKAGLTQGDVVALVGMTRARRKLLLLLGDSSTLCRHPFFVELLSYVKGVGVYRTAWAV
jgi:ATP-dependent RNA/DNA helicase IGHMBP2